MTAALNTLLDFITRHPEFAYATIFMISLSESLALVGLLVPGTVIMFGVGAIVATGRLGFVPVLLLAMAGAMAGDGISYALGRHYQERLTRFWPFSRYPNMLRRGEVFFRRHGGKSVLFGRFVGPVRPVIPLVAGMLGMSPARFATVNVLSAVGWAFTYLVPGVVIGTSLALVGAVSARLTILLLALLLILWAAFWLCRRGFVWLGKLGLRGERLLPLLSVALGLAGWLFLGVLEDVVTLDPLVQADESIYHALQSLRTHWGDQFMIAVTALGDPFMNLVTVLGTLFFLLYKRLFRPASYWIIAALGGAVLVQLFKWLIQTPRPITVYQGISAWSFPSGHTTMSVVLLGFLAILLVRSLSSRWGWLPFATAVAFSLLMALSRLYLGAHWLSDVLGGWALGWSWTALLGIFYHKKPTSLQIPAGKLLCFVTLTFLCAGSWHIWQTHSRDMDRYRLRQEIRSMSFSDWLANDWQQLPVRRIDLEGEPKQPITLQWAGDPQALINYLQQQAWTRADKMTLGSFLNFFLPAPSVQQLPLLPQLANGFPEDFLLFRNQGGQRSVLRLWRSSVRLESGRGIWFGNVEMQRAETTAGLLTLPEGQNDFSRARDGLAKTLSRAFALKRVTRVPEHDPAGQNWDGQVLLAWDGPLS